MKYLKVHRWVLWLPLLLSGAEAFGSEVEAPRLDRRYFMDGSLLMGWLPRAGKMSGGLGLGLGLRLSSRFELRLASEIYLTGGQPAVRDQVNALSQSILDSPPTITDSIDSGFSGSSDDSFLDDEATHQDEDGLTNSQQVMPEIYGSQLLSGRFFLSPVTSRLVPFIELGGGARFAKDGIGALGTGTLGYQLMLDSRSALTFELGYRLLYGLSATQIWGETGAQHELHVGLGFRFDVGDP